MTTKAGETVRVVYEQDDANGEVMARIVCEWFGFDNAEANLASMQLVGAVVQTADGWRQTKAPGGKLPDIGQEAKNPGAIR